MRRNFFSEDFVRVISGKARGLNLYSPEGNDTRPTLDRVKEALFSMLLPYIQEAKVLDLFAGSGALGIEALSRGAYKAYFIDDSDKAIECVRKNVSISKFQEESVILKKTAEDFLNTTDEKFDIIFIDPPYSKGLYSDVLRSIYEYNVLSDEGLIVVEWDFDIGFTNEIEFFSVLKEKKYGRVGVTLLRRKAN